MSTTEIHYRPVFQSNRIFPKQMICYLAAALLVSWICYRSYHSLDTAAIRLRASGTHHDWVELISCRGEIRLIYISNSYSVWTHILSSQRIPTGELEWMIWQLSNNDGYPAWPSKKMSRLGFGVVGGTLGGVYANDNPTTTFRGLIIPYWFLILIAISFILLRRWNRCKMWTSLNI